MRARVGAIVIGSLDCLAAAALAATFLNSGSDPATKGFDIAAGWATIILLALTALSTFVFSFLRRAPRTALAFSLGFPAGFALLFVAAAIAFTFFIP
jgi:hypothetical protein